MESFEYYRYCSSPQPGNASSPGPPSPLLGAQQAWGRTSGWPSGQQASTPGAGCSAAAGSWQPGSQLEEVEVGECDSPGSFEYSANETFAREAVAAIKHSGWLLKAYGKGPQRQWRKHWVYLKDDRLCYTPDPGGPGGVRYIPLDRIPLRALPRGYGPKIGITLVDSRQLDTSRAAAAGELRGDVTGCTFSMACGSHTHFWAAGTPAEAKEWVELVTKAWARCVKHTARSTHHLGPDELLVMREARWRAENDALRRSLAQAEADAAGQQQPAAVDTDGERWKAWLQQQQVLEAAPAQQTVMYDVQIVTGTVKGAGTSSQVYMDLYGREGGECSSGEHRLVCREGGKQPFQRGATDSFKLCCTELGELWKVRIYHDSSGQSPAWFLEEVRVRKAPVAGSSSAGSGSIGDNTSGGWTIFPCHRWLAVDQEDGRVMRDLRPGVAAGAVTYKIVTVTSDIRGANTDANVSIVLHGSRRDSQRHALATGPRDFERGATNEFSLQDEDLGEIQAVTIGHDGSGASPAWHLQQVTVINCSSGQEYVFPCRQWFDASSGDGKTERRLQLSRGQPEPCWYTVVVCTSDARGAGTTSEVFLSLHGSEGSSLRVKLPSQAGDFERGQEDVFRVQLPRVGPLQSLTIGHNCCGSAPEWHLEQVEVTDEQAGETWYFECGRWLSGSKGDGLTERTLVATTQNPRDRLASYRVDLHTSDIRAAGTSASVWVELHGTAGSSGVQKLQSSPKSFNRGAVDVFSMACSFLGDLQKLTVGHDNSGDSPAWHLHKVVVACAKTGTITEFPCDRWLASSEDDGCTTRDLYPNSSSSKLAQYKITSHTSDLRGAGTTAKVFMEVVGKQAVVSLQLDNDKNNFQRGRTDTFQVVERDVGEIQHIRVWHDGSGTCDSWHLHFVEITRGGDASSPTLYFNCNDWLSPPSCERILKPSLEDPRLSMVTYELTVWTSDLKGAGTDSNISCVLHGQLGSSPPLPLAGGAGSFERGKVDQFTFTLPSLGQLQQLTLQSDARGKSAGWHCEMASVTDSTGTLYFACDRWLDSAHGLQAQLSGSLRSPRLDFKLYQLSVLTSSVPNSGTDGDVYVELLGSSGSSGWRRVSPSGHAAGMERAQRVGVELQLRDLGIIQQARVRVDNQTCGWHLEALEVTDASSRERWFLPCHAWLNERHGTERTLSAFKQAEVAQYKLRLHTSDLPGAGTDARVFVELRGRSGRTSRIWPGIPAASLQPGQVAECTFSWGPVGELQQLLVGHDGGAAGSPGWHLDYAEVVHLGTGQVVYFDSNEWLSRDHGDGCAERTLVASSTDPSFTRCTYQITVHTSNMRTAGLPDGLGISTVLAGSKGSLPRSQLKRAGAFGRSQQDTFQVVGPDIGAFASLSIRVEDPAGRASWHLASVEVHNLKTGTHALFVCRDWVGSSGAVELAASDSSVLDDVEYEVVVHTSDVRNGGTAADVLLQLHGSQCDSGTLQLPSEQASFKRGSADTFHVLAPDVGRMQELHVWHSGKRPEDAWHLDYIQVTHKASGETAFFVCRDWVAESQRRVLPATAADPALDLTTYKAIVHTGDIKAAGTDASVFLELRGELQSSGPVLLINPDDSNDAAFERGQSDAFTLRLPRLGNLTEAVVGHDGKGQRPSWHLDCLEVHELQSGQVWYFKCGEWLSSSKGAGTMQRILKAQTDNPCSSLVKYRITVSTSDLRGAGTDAAVSIQLFGEGGKTGRLALAGEEHAFERGQQSEFALNATGVGWLSKIWIGHDNRGGDAAWHLKEVKVLDTASGEQYLFECNSWIDGDGCPVGRELLPSTGSSPSQVRLTQYEVVIKTGDRRNAGTDADVTISITGSTGCTGPHKLAAGADAFKRGATDCFLLQLPSVGKLERLEIARTAQGQQQGWFVEWVKIRDGSSNQLYYFFAKAWLDEAHGLAAVLQPGQGKQYKVIVHTSNVADAGTDCGVHINLHGSAGSTGATQLASPKAGVFDTGAGSEFVLETLDVGELQKLTLWHDCQGDRRSWHCACVEVGGAQDGKLATFPCGMWLSKERGDGLVERELYPEGSPQALKQVPYKISIHTSGDLPASGTCCSVGLELHGSHNVAGPIVLENDGTCFGQGSVDTFRVEATDVGDLQQLCVRLEVPVDAAVSRWFLDLVEVVNEATGKASYFVCRKWLERSNSFEVTLLASARDPTKEEIDYKICIVTSAFSGAETSGNVIVDIAGAKGRSGVLTLRNKGGMSFRAGQRDTFHLHLPSLGSLTELSVGHDGPRDWHLDKCEVTDSSSGTTYVFPCEQWVESSGSGGVLGTTLKLKAYTPDPASLPVQYRCTVTVEEIVGPIGKDCLTLQLFGTKGSTGQQGVDLTKFVRTGKRQMTTFFEADNVERMEKIRIGLADQEAECSVLVSTVDVVNQSSGDAATFACSEWLRSSDGYDLELAAEEAPTEVLCTYRVEVQTSDLRRAGTTGHVYLTIIGEEERIGPYKLSNLGEHFQRGQLDVFQVSNAPDIGTLRQIEVRHDGQGKKNGWHLAWLKVHNDTTGAVAMFNCNRWIDKQTGDPQIVAMLVAVQPPQPPPKAAGELLPSRMGVKDKLMGRAALERQEARLQEAATGPAGEVPRELQPGYQVSFHTSRMCGSGTNAKVFFELVGSRDSSGIVMPVAAKRSFKPGRVDVFTYPDMQCVGEMQAVRVGTDGTGLFPAWHLRKVEVMHLPTNQRRVFACYNWIDKQCKYVRWLQLDEQEAPSPLAAAKRGLAHSSAAGQAGQGSPGVAAAAWEGKGRSGRPGPPSSPLRASPAAGARRGGGGGWDALGGDARSPKIGARW